MTWSFTARSEKSNCATVCVVASARAMLSGCEVGGGVNRAIAASRGQKGSKKEASSAVEEVRIELKKEKG